MVVNGAPDAHNVGPAPITAFHSKAAFNGRQIVRKDTKQPAEKANELSCLLRKESDDWN